MATLVRLTREISGALVSGLTDRGTTLGRKAEIVGGFVASGLRLTAGMVVRPKLGPRPEKPMVLWDFERCVFSRYVRESLSELDLDADVRPCPMGGTRFRPETEGKGVPMLEDPNAGLRLRGSREIVRHLHATYGTRARSGFLAFPPVRVVLGVSQRLLTNQRGAHARPSKAPEKPLELWSFEASPYCRLVRATLSELELPYRLHNVAKDSAKRPEFLARAGRLQFPYLHDPNTGVSMFESLEIQRYLEKTYAA